MVFVGEVFGGCVMPVGPYKNLPECVKELMLEGYSRRAAERICQAMKDEKKRRGNGTRQQDR